VHVAAGAITRTVTCMVFSDPQQALRRKEYVMAPESRTESELTLPKDLLSEVQRHLPNARGDFHVEAFKPSLVHRMFGFLDRGRTRE
jgi:hypothetical protein